MVLIDAPRPKRKHGCKPGALNIDKERLLLEAQSWSPTQIVNWSEIARRYGLTQQNGGQSIKEFLKEHNISVALTDQTPNRAPVGDERLYQEVYHSQCTDQSPFKNKSLQKAGEILVGEEVVETPYSQYALDRGSNTVTKRTATVYARKICLADIRKKLLQKHQRMGSSEII